jgi:toluene monooxygenase electron transfer component
MKIEIIGSGDIRQTFESKPNENILYSGLQHGIGLPYECATGTCGSCKAKRISGQIEWLWDEAPARKILKSEDDFLMCQCSASSDLQLEVRSKLKENKDPRCVPDWLGAVVIDSRLVAQDVKTLSVRLSKSIDFLPGQFMVLEFEGVTGGRAWSMTNHAETSNILHFVIKKKPNGDLSKFLFAHDDLSGLKAKAFGPIGKATYLSNLEKELICIAGGTGIAGMMSILEEYIRGGAHLKNRATVYFGVRTSQDLFFANEFSKLVDQSKGSLEVVVAFSDEKPSTEIIEAYPALKFDQGFIHEVAEREIVGCDHANSRAYIAGPPPLVDGALRMLLLKARLPASEILYDKFG